MPIPKYDEMYRAFLDCLADGQLHRSKEVKDTVAGVFSVSEKERAEMLPSGKQQLFDNRIGWTRTYLKKAGLVQSPSRGIYVITPAGRQVLNENPPQIDNLYLQRFESFRKFISPNNNEEIALSTPMEKVSGKTPQDVLDEAFQQINTTLADDLLSEVMKQPPAFFEHLVVKLLMQMGYGGSVDNAGTVIGQTGDEGIDGIIREDKLGFSLIYIMNLIRNIHFDDPKQKDYDIKHIKDELGRTDNPQLLRKVEILQAFLDRVVVGLESADEIDAAYNDFENEAKREEIVAFAKTEDIDASMLTDIISEYEFSGTMDAGTIRDRIEKPLPLLKKRSLVNRIVDFIRQHTEKYQ